MHTVREPFNCNSTFTGSGSVAGAIFCGGRSPRGIPPCGGNVANPPPSLADALLLAAAFEFAAWRLRRDEEAADADQVQSL